MKDRNNEKMYPHPYLPVGFIVLTVVDTNPSKWFSGTWELIAQGRTLVGVDTNDTDFNEVKKTGGEKTHTLSIEEMPTHKHNLKGALTGETKAITNTGNDWAQTTTSWQQDTFISSTGGGQAHNNLQPYFTCYIWCRIA